MRLDYGTLLSPTPIKLSIGSIKKHTLREISELSFDRFNYYEIYLKMTPEKYYSKIIEESGTSYWDTLDESTRKKMTMYDLIKKEEQIRNVYVDLFNFFFIEFVGYKEGFFIIFNQEVDLNNTISPETICGVIDEDSFQQVICLIQQICCIFEDSDDHEEDVKFKNNIARKLYERMLKEQKKNRAKKKFDKNLYLPNIISAVSNSHPTINPLSVWDLTLFQLFDSFNRLRTNKMYDIDARRVSIWGDEKKTFDVALWYKNEYDKK